MAHPSESHSPANKFRFICPILGIERRYAEEIEIHEAHMKGYRPGAPIVHALKRASKDPVPHMIKAEWAAGRALFFTTDESAPVEHLPKSIVEKVKSVIVCDCHMDGLSDGERHEIATINDRAVPADGREAYKPPATASKTAHKRGSVPKPTEAPPAPKKDEGFVAAGDYAEAVTKAAAKEVAAKGQEAPKPPPAPVTPAKPVLAASAPAPAPATPAAAAPKLSLLEMAKRMKNQAA